MNLKNYKLYCLLTIPPFKLIHEGRKRPLQPKAPIKKGDIMIREYDDFCIQIPGTGNETNLPIKSFVLSRIPLFFKVHLHPPIREMSQKDEK